MYVWYVVVVEQKKGGGCRLLSLGFTSCALCWNVELACFLLVPPSPLSWPQPGGHYCSNRKGLNISWPSPALCAAAPKTRHEQSRGSSFVSISFSSGGKGYGSVRIRYRCALLRRSVGRSAHDRIEFLLPSEQQCLGALGSVAKSSNGISWRVEFFSKKGGSRSFVKVKP